MTYDRPTIVTLGVVLLLVFGAGAATLDTTVTDADGDGNSASGSADPPATEDGGTDLANVSDGVFPQVDNWLEDSNESDAKDRDDVDGESGGDDAGASRSSPELPTYGLVLLAIVVLGVIGIVLGRSRSGNVDRPDSSADEPSEEEVLADVGATAGDAAADIADGATPENVVYRTWVEMTRQLDVDRRRSRTPGEFAAAAVDAGMRRDDVQTLTKVFEQVRYGDEPVTEERRDQAVEALRHIEETYSDRGRAE